MTTAIRALTRSDTRDTFLAAGLALLLGASLIFLSGFAHAGIVHDAAHDQRHALAFPCH